MYNSKISGKENKILLNMGIDPLKCSDYQILCLPENFQQGSKDNLYDADSAIIVLDSTNYTFYLWIECFHPFLCK